MLGVGGRGCRQEAGNKWPNGSCDDHTPRVPAGKEEEATGQSWKCLVFFKPTRPQHSYRPWVGHVHGRRERGEKCVWGGTPAPRARRGEGHQRTRRVGFVCSAEHPLPLHTPDQGVGTRGGLGPAGHLELDSVGPGLDRGLKGQRSGWRREHDEVTVAENSHSGKQRVTATHLNSTWGAAGTAAALPPGLCVIGVLLNSGCR